MVEDSILRGEAALLYADRMGVQVVMANTVTTTAERARALLDVASKENRALRDDLLESVVVRVAVKEGQA